MEANNMKTYVQPQITIIAVKCQQHVMAISDDNYHGLVGEGSGSDWEYGSNSDRAAELTFWDDEGVAAINLWEE